MENTCALIMAGGGGTRFWPKSRQNFPKQFLSLFGKDTMLQMTANRLLKLIPTEKLYIVTTLEQKRLITRQLPWMPPGNIITEPAARNTAPCIGLSAIHIRHRNPDAIMVVCPSDHLILNSERFTEIIQSGVRLVRENPHILVTIGIEPTYSSTGYGYIQKGKTITNETTKAYHVRTFAEKPDVDTAKKFFESKEFFWNSGIFIWHVETILNYFQELLPDIYSSLLLVYDALDTKKLNQVTDTAYEQIYNQSIDYGILEKCSQVVVMDGDFGWSDLGSWDEIYKISSKDEQGNVIIGAPLVKDVRNSYIETSDRTVGIIGVSDLIVVDTNDSLLICKRDLSQDVKWLAGQIRQKSIE
ncbi:MAG TPA: mannose-1-phosphate guanylyltransferase [bacterium]|nr:mannose-1-phosphate guanylyltransferase [bacterium]HPN46118.1 mannose-1-phosphate guanylyltransferase [bacterium]